MKQQPRFHVILFVFLLLGAINVHAQLDSLYTQQWNRDPITNLNSTTSAQRQIITAEQIRVSGYTQLSQVFQLIDGWTIASLESTPNYQRLQSNGAGSYNHQNWVLMLNGQRLEMDRDPVLYVNQLAIPVYDIERIEIVNSNGMYLGEFTQHGLINIITKKSNTDGIRVGALTSTIFGIDNNGIYYDHSSLITNIGYRKNKFNVNWTLASIANPAGRIEVQYEGKKITHQIQTKSIMGSNNSEYRMISYLGLWNINEHNQIRLSSSINKINTTPNLRNYPISQHLTTLQHRYLKTYKNGNFIWQNGLGFDNENSNNTLTNQSNDNYILKPYTSINLPITRKINLFTDIQVAFANDKIGPKISVGIYKRVSLISNYSFVVGYNEMLLEESFLTTVNQDINAINRASYYYNPKIATADFYYNLNIGNSVKFSFNSGLKNSYDLPDYNYRVFTNPIYMSGYYYIKRSTNQFNWVNRINFHYDIVRNLVFDINYMHTGILNSWDDNLRNIPKHKFTFIVQYDLPKKFTLWSRNYLQSKTTFLNYDAGYSLSTTKPYGNIPVLLTWEIGLSKKLFKDHINLNLTARNLFAKSTNYYPTDNNINYSGAVFISITANIDGIGKAKVANP